MLTFELSQLISRYYWRWILGAGVLCLNALFYLKSQTFVPHSIWEFAFSFLTSPGQSTMILPVLFFIMTVDVIRLDITNRYVQYLSVRANTRTNWFIAKLSAIFVMAILYTIMTIIIPLLIGMFSGLETAYIMGEESLFISSTSLVTLLSCIFPTFVITLTALGTLLSILTLYIYHHFIVSALGVILCLLSYLTFARYHDIGFAYKWLLTTHMYLLPKIPTKLSSSNQLVAPSFAWSYGYLCCLYITAIILGFMRIRKMNL
ncbi:hypothetical protein [Brevibacillus sp. SAFN-007a]|uniref:hypothetical protein n=1 Tax=Brevibacillus sp. SAFN-007a TaxID=3436862 RepID=UPI003F7EF76B